MKYNYIHGMSKTKLYRAWDSMKARCYRKTTAPYPRYGGRGISVCYEWRESFISFMDWSIANGYSDGLSLDRIDPNGNYEPSNCRWVTMKEQENNKPSNRWVEYCGETHTISEWCGILGLSYHALRNRLRRGWSVERALTTKERIYNKKGKEKK